MRRQQLAAHRSLMYVDGSTVRVAREQYFAANGFSDKTYREKWARFKLGPLPVILPNTKSRQKALPLHDLHHIATGYDTSVIGESEISAFELGGGCGRYAAAWLLNAGVFAMGLVLAPVRTYRAFLRGRHSRNLYRDGWHDSLLELSVADLRNRIGTTATEVNTTSKDRVAFGLTVWAVVTIVTAPLVWILLALML
ncbi:MAG TPA: hypothetical protein VLB44_25660 [Kofleriaceae bacterium]|nr:hypothetical protein [Kofleriaceae bacterium]